MVIIIRGGILRTVVRVIMLCHLKPNLMDGSHRCHGATPIFIIIEEMRMIFSGSNVMVERRRRVVIMKLDLIV